MKHTNTLEDLFLQYSVNEPHTLLHAGKLSNFIHDKGLDNKVALSIGLDLLKDSIVSVVNGLDLTVLDIDAHAVEICNKAAFRLGKKIKYRHSDFFRFEESCLSVFAGGGGVN